MKVMMGIYIYNFQIEKIKKLNTTSHQNSRTSVDSNVKGNKINLEENVD